jgi:hypothetical protein
VSKPMRTPFTPTRPVLGTGPVTSSPRYGPNAAHLPDDGAPIPRNRIDWDAIREYDRRLSEHHAEAVTLMLREAVEGPRNG